ncbi:MAG: hypothetical protein ACNYPI_01345 [Arenicellales bacterium WSBS_2016_MAG_OTU3]
MTYTAPGRPTRPTVTLSGHPAATGRKILVSVVTFSEDVTGLATGFTGIASLQSYVTVINATAGLLGRAGSNSICDLTLILASDTTSENTSDISVTFKTGFATWLAQKPTRSRTRLPLPIAP